MEFLEIFRAGGPIMGPLLFISIAAVALAVERALAFRERGRVFSDVDQEILDLVRQGNEKEALRLADETSSPVTDSMAVIVRNRHLPIADIERRATTASEDDFLRLERFLPALDTFTTLSPLLGLLGTILGMVRVFEQFTAANNDENAKARILAGVGESLYATAFGITIAVFCFAIYNYFSARQRTISLETERNTQNLLAFYHRQKVAAGQDTGESSYGGKVAASKGRGIKPTKIEIIPMIDTMFFLLVFFILSSIGIIKINGAHVALPQAVKGEPQKPAQLTVSIDANKEIKINNADVPPGRDVGPYLKHEVLRQVGDADKALTEATVVINADQNVPNGVVVRTMDEARAVGVSHFAIATVPIKSATTDGENP